MAIIIASTTTLVPAIIWKKKRRRRMKFLQKAFEIASEHPFYDDLPSLHGAIIVKGGRILSKGINRPRRNAFINIFAHHEGCNIHAECDAILRARKKTDLNGAKMFVARMRKIDKLPGTSRPCEMCQKIMVRYGIKKVFYTDVDGTYNMMKVA
jgi:deoxycytidylate deaminase